MKFDPPEPHDFLAIHNTVKSFDCPAKRVRDIAGNVYSREKIGRRKRTDLICCSDYLIRKLNRDYRNIDKVTDVLSFPFGEADLLGEIYISIPRSVVQARRYGVAVDDEFVRLFIHGLLHLAGFDHTGEDQRTIMERKERSYFR